MSSRSDLRNAMLCGFSVVVAVGLTIPVANSSFNDDWSYAFTVKRLLETGRLTYNGWASAAVISQVYWGWIWVKLFGYSLTVLRLSTLPLAAAAVSICYLLGRRAGLRPSFAIFGSLLLGLNPLFLPYACTFMTDGPGVFFILLSLYLLVRAMDSPGTYPAIVWLMAGLLVGWIGGTSRQIVWVAPLVLGPYIAWSHRQNLVLVSAAIIGSMLVFAGAVLTLNWFARQLYSVPETSVTDCLRAAIHNRSHFTWNVLAMALTAIWLLLPAMWGFARGWTSSRGMTATILFLTITAVLAGTRPGYAKPPWMINTITATGVMNRSELPGIRPVALPMVARITFGVVVFAVSCAMLADLLLQLTRPLTAAREAIRYLLWPHRGQTALAATTIFALVYITFLLPRCAIDMTYDRYLIPMLPCLAFPILLARQKNGDQKIPRIAWALLAIYAAYGIAITQDVTALARARATATERLMQAGVPRTQIDAGVEFNSQTQLQTVGYMNDPRFQIPKNPFKKHLGLTPAVKAIYRLEFAPAPDSQKTSYGSISYFSYLYPFHRTIWIDRVLPPLT